MAEKPMYEWARVLDSADLEKKTGPFLPVASHNKFSNRPK